MSINLEQSLSSGRRKRCLRRLELSSFGHTGSREVKEALFWCTLSHVVEESALSGIWSHHTDWHAVTPGIGPGERSALLAPHIPELVAIAHTRHPGLLVGFAVAPVRPIVQTVEVAGVGVHIVVVLNARGEVGVHLEVAILCIHAYSVVYSIVSVCIVYI